jgi:hypothetical protein
MLSTSQFGSLIWVCYTYTALCTQTQKRRTEANTNGIQQQHEEGTLVAAVVVVVALRTVMHCHCEMLSRSPMDGRELLNDCRLVVLM